VLSCDLTILCETRPLFLESSEGYQGQLFSRRVLFGFKKNTMVLQNSLVLKTYEVFGINKPWSFGNHDIVTTVVFLEV